MKRLLTLLLCFSSNLVLALPQQREISLTFDDAPTPDSSLFTGEERTQKIIAALKDQRVGDALIYVKADGINEKSKLRLLQYTNAGFHLANHSYSHQSLTALGVDAFIADAQKAQEELKHFKNVLPFYRYPYLDYGNSVKTLVEAQNQLNQLGYRDGYVTVKSYDWYISDLMVNTPAFEKSACIKNAKRFYIDQIERSIEFYDRLAQQTLQRSPKHVLLLHENDAAALYLGDLIAHLKGRGWKIIPPQEAYADPIANEFPALTAHSQGRIAAIANSKGVATELLKSPEENEGNIKREYSLACAKN